MIEQTTFLGLPLHTQQQRRRLVVLYYLFIFCFAVAALWKPHASLGPLLAQTIFLGGMLGGIRIGGPVKPYTQPGSANGAGLASDLTTLNLSGTPRRFTLFAGLDEREQGERDHAHYIAYRFLRWTVLFGGFALCCMALCAPAWLPGHAPALLWVFVIYLLSLPQAVVLWTEAPAGQAELIEFRPA